MFTGIVEGTGSVHSAARRGDVMAVRIDVGGLFAGLPLGGSIAVNGCCLTAVRSDARGFDVELTEETLRRTRFEERLVPGALVNLERPMRADGRFDGHVVQGHVDGVGEILGRVPGAQWETVRFSLPPKLGRYVVEKGSITVDGVSLTVVDVDDETFSVGLIPTTLALTTLGHKAVGDPVNLEVDMIAKYLERLMEGRTA